MVRPFVLLVAAISLIFPPAQDPPPGSREALLGFDPVTLVETGEEELGSEEITLVREGFWYLFTNAEHRARFEANPERYQIQLDGVCAQNGRGLGEPEIFYVREGKIYIFSSSYALEEFRKQPSAYLEPPPGYYGTGNEGRQSGMELLYRMQTWLGGAQRLQSVESLHLVGTAPRQDGVLEMEFWYSQGHLLAQWKGPQGARAQEVGTESGRFINAWGKFEMSRAVHRVYQRIAARVLATLWPSLGRVQEAVLIEQTASADSSVKIALNPGDSPILARIDPKTGEFRGISYQGRGPDGRWGEIVVNYSDFREIGGIRFPFLVEATWEGEVYPNSTYTLSAVEVNPVVPNGTFTGPDSEDKR